MMSGLHRATRSSVHLLVCSMWGGQWRQVPHFTTILRQAGNTEGTPCKMSGMRATVVAKTSSCNI